MELNDNNLLQTKAYLNGEWVGADSGATFPVTNPATGDVIAQVARLGVTETRRAIEAAQAAFRHRARRLKVWAGGVAGDQVCGHGRDRVSGYQFLRQFAVTIDSSTVTSISTVSDRRCSTFSPSSV